MEKNLKFMVRVSCMTYNHAPYIVDAMNGFTMQQTSFPFVCTIIDDASTDGEQQVIQNYIETNFSLSDDNTVYRKETDDYQLVFAQHKENCNCYFLVIYLKYNHFSINKSKAPYLEEWTDTKYVAICEGDDYWIHPGKLEMEVAFLEANRDYGLCYTGIGVKNQKTGKVSKKTMYNYPSTIGFWELLITNRIGTLTVLYRKVLGNKYFEEINPVSHNWKMGDYPMWLWFGMESKIKRFDIVTSVYRISSGSASHAVDENAQTDFLKSVMDIKLFFMDYYHLTEEKKREIIKKFANGIAKVALLKNNRKMYEYGMIFKKEMSVDITIFDKLCGFLLSHKWSRKVIEIYKKTRVDYF